MSVADNLRLVDRWLAAVNAEDWDELNRVYADDVLAWASSWGPEERKTWPRSAIQANSDRFYKAWPDLHLEKEQAFGADDWVCLRVISSATHQSAVHLADGPSIPPTGKKFRVCICIVFKIEDGRITQTLEYYDTAAWWRQLGVSPPSVPIVMDSTKEIGAS